MADVNDIQISQTDNDTNDDGKRNTNQQEAASPKSKTEVQADPDYEKEAQSLRWLLKLYFYHPFKWTGQSISIHFGKCAIFIVQLIKVILITVMLFSFGRDRENFSQLVNKGHITLRNLFMEHWDASWETLPYPPAHGEFAVYEKEDMTGRINYAVERYYNVPEDAIGYYILPTQESLMISMKYFDFGGFGSVSGDDISIRETRFKADKGLVLSDGKYSYNVTREFEYQNLSQPIKKLLSLTLIFKLKSVRVFSEEQRALCLNIECQLKFEDLENNGQVIEDLETFTTRVKCEEMNVNVTDLGLQRTSEAFAGTVLGLCSISLAGTVLIFVFGCFVYWRTKRFMKNHYKTFYNQSETDETDLPRGQYIQFFKLWDISSIVADCATLFGTTLAFKKRTVFDVSLLDSYTVWLGVGCLLAWFSLLRYFKFHSKFHLLFTTVYMAMGDVFAYLVCVGILFIGFWACGYVVLGPYNVKFSTPAAATETLLSVVNGDEIYATIAILDRHPNSYIWMFTRVYIWTYVAIFTVVVLNLLVAIVLSAYEVIKAYYEKKEEDRDLSALELALKRMVEKEQQSSLRQSVTDLISSHVNMKEEESEVRAQLLKLFKIDKNDKIVPIMPRTLKVFIKDEVNKTGVKTEESRTFSMIMEFKICTKEKKD